MYLLVFLFIDNNAALCNNKDLQGRQSQVKKWFSQRYVMSSSWFVNLSMVLVKNSATAAREFAPAHWEGFWNQRDSVPCFQINKSNNGGLK
jgi:hypothetical protein